MSKPRKPVILLALVALFLVSLLTACGPPPPTTTSAGSTGQASPTQAPTPTPTPTPIDRHGLPDFVPLPGNALFHSQNVVADFKIGPFNVPHQFNGQCLDTYTSNTWIWTVASDPATVQSFYQQSFASKGGSRVFKATGCHVENTVLVNCKGMSTGQILLVEINATIKLQEKNASTTVMAPAGGSVIAIHLDSNAHGKPDPILGFFNPTLADYFCS